MIASTRFLRSAAAAAAVLATVSCASMALQRRLDPESREFFSKVRYIITREERKAFLALPAEERAPFVEAFWKKRDPKPETETNEFKNQYYARIEEANRLFGAGGGGEPGWLQDRGRIYILLGPPSERNAYPRGVSFYGIPVEIWYYGWFPIIFEDAAWNGDFKLAPSSAGQLATIMSTQIAWKPEVTPEKGRIDCRVRARRTGAGKGIVRVFIPYIKVWLNDEIETLKTTFKIRIELLDEAGGRVAEWTSEHPFEIAADRAKDLFRDEHEIEIPVEAPPGTYWVGLSLENAADGSKVDKKVKLVL